MSNRLASGTMGLWANGRTGPRAHDLIHKTAFAKKGPLVRDIDAITGTCCSSSPCASFLFDLTSLFSHNGGLRDWF